MTLESTISAETMLGDGVTRQFTFTFRAWPGMTRVVISNPQGVDADVTGLSEIDTDESGGGYVLYPKEPLAEPLPAGHKITVMRDMDFKQETNIETPARFDAEVIEAKFDKLTAQDQQLLEALGRTLRVSIGGGQDPETAVYEVLTARDEARAAVRHAESAAQRSETASVCAAGAVGAAIAEGSNQAACVAAEGTKYLTAADNAARAAKQSAREAEEATANIQGFANNAQAFFGLRVDKTLRLLCDKTGRGDIMQMRDYDYAVLLPGRMRFELSRSGDLLLHDPYAPQP